MATVSIIMPTFNSGTYISVAIESVTSQIFTDWELIIIDDGSKDNTSEIVNHYSNSDNRIKYIRNAFNKGVSHARNIGLNIASGEYVAFLDSDDFWDVNFLKKMYDFCKKNNYNFCTASYHIFDERKNKFKKSFLVEKKFNYYNLLKKNSISCLTVLVKKKLIGSTRMIEIKNEDYLFWLEIAKKVDWIYGNEECLATYRLRSGSRSSNKFKVLRARWQIYRKFENLGLISSIYYFLHYLYYSINKYYFND